MAGKVTERTYYTFLMDVIREYGGTGVQEISYNSEPDIVFNLIDREWILGVKIGESTPILKDAFIQYQRHKKEGKKEYGILLFLPDTARKIKPEHQSLTKAVFELQCSCFIDTPYKTEMQNKTFPQILQFIQQEVVVKIAQKERKGYSLNTTVILLQQHVADLMDNIKLSDEELLKVVTDKKLLSEIGHLDEKETIASSQFLASYVILSQILFLRLFSRSRPDILPPLQEQVSHLWMRTAFNKILDINYRPIFEIDVLDAIPASYLSDTFDLIWGLEIETLKHELPGRIFHELMPERIRKMVAAFYTKPQAAELLARLTIHNSEGTVFDPACGSGTILVSAYKRKLELYQEEGKAGNPHKRFCEGEIFGADIMPFAVHLTSANLASLEPATTIDRTQIIQGDSLHCSKGVHYSSGIQTSLFPVTKRGYTQKGELHEIEIGTVDAVLMNPPFTKVERGIKKFVDLTKFGEISGKEIGLWGHFIGLADDFLAKGGIFGGVIPISILRGSETRKIREYVFRKWTPVYIIKLTLNYGFSESAEYRDILFIAKKGPAPKNHKVKFVLIKKDLKELSNLDISYIANQIEVQDDYRGDILEIQSFQISKINEKINNLMWFCGASEFKNRDELISFFEKFSNKIIKFPEEYFVTGYRSSKDISKFLFLTRNTHPSRIEYANLFFTKEDSTHVWATSVLGVPYRIEKSALIPSIRTSVGISSYFLKNSVDYIAFMPYRELDNVLQAIGFNKPAVANWKAFWNKTNNELKKINKKIAIIHRINPYSPNVNYIAFYSDTPFSPSDSLHVITEENNNVAKSICVILNSVVFLSQFFLLKEETTGRYINIRIYDFYEMDLYPKEKYVEALVKVFDIYSNLEFLSFKDQFDQDFNERYNTFKLKKTNPSQTTLNTIREIVNPSEIRMNFDLDVCKALDIPMTRDELLNIYTIFVQEMITTKGLSRD